MRMKACRWEEYARVKELEDEGWNGIPIASRLGKSILAAVHSLARRTLKASTTNGKTKAASNVHNPSFGILEDTITT